jgi:hypothetical protein
MGISLLFIENLGHCEQKRTCPLKPVGGTRCNRILKRVLRESAKLDRCPVQAGGNVEMRGNLRLQPGGCLFLGMLLNSCVQESIAALKE